MIKSYKSIILFFALANTTFNYAMTPRPLVNICLTNICNQLTKNPEDLELLNKLETLTTEVSYLIKKVLIYRYIDKIWDRSSEISKTALVGHKGRVNAIAISPDTNFIVTSTDDHTACIWRAGDCMRLIGHNSDIHCIAISNDNKFIVTGSADNNAIIWDAESGKRLLQLSGHTANINSIDISIDNKFIVTGSNDNSSRVWNATSGQCICQLLGHAQQINAVCVLPDNNIITASDDKTVKLWDSHGNFIKQFEHKDKITNIIKVANQCFTIEGPNDFVTYYWDLNNGLYVLKDYPERNSRLFSMHRWKMKLPSGKPVSLQLLAHHKHIEISTSYKHEWLELAYHRSRVTAVEIAPDLSFIVTGSAKDNVIYIWSIRTIIDKLLSEDVSIKSLISFLELNKASNNSTCALG